MKGASFSGPAFGPVRFDLDDFFGVFQSAVVIFHGGVGAGAVGVEDMVAGVDLNCLCELFSVAANQLCLFRDFDR